MDPGLAVEDDVRVALDSILAFQADLVGAAAVAGAVLDTLVAQLRTVQDTLSLRPNAPGGLAQRAETLAADGLRLRTVLRGPRQEGIAQQEASLALSSLVNRLYTTTEAWTGLPTADQNRLTGWAYGQLMEVLAELRPLVERGLPALRQALTDAGIPWPAGDPPSLPRDLLPRYLP
jgi:hypothetical protein